MLDDSDITFAGALERAIRKELFGDENTQGLYKGIRGSPNWEMFQRTNGMILAYEAVLGEMRRIARQMNSGGSRMEQEETRSVN